MSYVRPIIIPVVNDQDDSKINGKEGGGQFILFQHCYIYIINKKEIQIFN